MVDPNAVTLVPPPPADVKKRPEPDAAFKAQERLTMELSEHKDPHVRLIAHMSSRQLEMSQRISDLALSIEQRDANMQQTLTDINRKLGDLSGSYDDLERRTGDLEREEQLNGAEASPVG